MTVIKTMSWALAATALAVATATPVSAQIQLAKIGGYTHGGFAVGASEIVAHDEASQRLFVVNAQAATIDILDISDPTSPSLVGTIDVSAHGSVANSVAVHDGVVAVAIEATVKQNPGVVAFYDIDGTLLKTVTVGALPDMLTFTPDGKYVLVANEGEPNATYTVDPVGSVSIIEIKQGVDDLVQSDVVTVDFSAYNNATLDPSIRVFGPNATVAQDFEPEYIAVSENSKKAYVTLQENNALAVIDIKKGKIESLNGLGFKDHSLTANALDPSDRDGGIHIAAWPVHGMYLPDAVAAFKHEGQTYLVMANEGDARDYAGFAEERRVGDATYPLDPTAFPNAATLKLSANLGRLRTTRTMGDTDGDGDYDEMYTFGARSFTIRDDDGAIVYDSGDDLEQITALAYPTQFNSTNDANGSFDTRSDDKGPEPEGLDIGDAFGTRYVFVGLERIGGIAVFDIDDPTAPAFVQYINTRIFTGNALLGTAGDLGPEGVHFIAADDSPISNPLLVLGNEISGTTAIFEITASGDNLVKGGMRADVRTSRIASLTPNPATEATTISFTLADPSHVELSLVDARGASISEVVDASLATGDHQVSLDVSALPTGMYYIVLRADAAVVEVRPLNVMR